ncbi:LysR substrate-binding domain-containing protein [Rhizobium rhizogenes]|uniref:LysR substrate-binding domain-containing protein n=1 Tax=Rhizobium rhizogenes TaxID=359 RepID=UPI00157332F1|nr:LysR substrate-binding domain-containing protein [Rhizobium rhizogenes]NTF46115.1 hypothetical protein [Rhizobium rhizogenes]
MTISPWFRVQKSLEAGECDIALLTGIDSSDPHIVSFEVCRGEILVYAKEGHAIHDVSEITIETLAAYPLATGTKEGYACRTVTDLARQKGYELSVLQKIDLLEAIKAYAKRVGALGIFTDDGYKETRCSNTRPLISDTPPVSIQLASHKQFLEKAPVSLAWRALQKSLKV